MSARALRCLFHAWGMLKLFLRDIYNGRHRRQDAQQARDTHSDFCLAAQGHNLVQDTNEFHRMELFGTNAVNEVVPLL